MNRLDWTYLDDCGKAHQVILMHGARTGHVLVLCNTNIVLIDFEILQSKVFSFFIEDEMCEITIERKQNEFFYAFDINKEIDTPKNRARKEQEKKHIWQSVLFFSGILVAVAIFLTVFLNYQSARDTRMTEQILAKKGDTTFAKVFVKNKSVKYIYIADGDKHSYDLPYQETIEEIALNGFPLESGDEFELVYAPSNPRIHRINFKKPTPHQEELYFDRAIQKEEYLHTSNIDNTLAACRTQIAYELKGLAGLADFYHQDTPRTDNPLHNELTYKRLVRDVPFKQAFDKKCR